MSHVYGLLFFNFVSKLLNILVAFFYTITVLFLVLINLTEKGGSGGKSRQVA